MITFIAGLVIGAVIGTLIGANNVRKTKALAQKAQEELLSLKSRIG